MDNKLFRAATNSSTHLRRILFAFVAIAGLLVGGCDKKEQESSTKPVADKRVDQPKPGAAAFTQEIYVDDHGKMIAFISEEELELRDPNGSNLVCKYQKRGDSLRVELEGTVKQSWYFTKIDDGYQDEKGNQYLTPSASEAKRKRRIARLSQLRQIFVLLRMYSVEHKDAFPEKLDEVLIPGKIPGVQASDYDYFGTGKWSKIKPNNVVVCEKLDSPQDEYAVACADGTCRMYTKQQVLEARPAKQPGPASQK